MDKYTYISSIVQSLKSVERPGYFACGGKALLPLPALQVEGVPGIIGLPLSGAQATAIIEKCSQAPYGRGEETIVDTSVRNTWQLDPLKFTLKNAEWTHYLKDLCLKVKTELGCDECLEVTCELYKMLLYETGGFFKSHRDTEKAAGMFGTLVIQLPSDFEGGQLNVCHQGKQTTFDFSGIEGMVSFHYTAFYADCQHELCKVTKGYRLCLIYNLVYTGAESCPRPADNRVLIDEVVGAMRQWGGDASGPPMIAYALGHKYSEANLSFRGLKNVDRAVADVLRNAAKEVGFDLYLAIVTLSQHWCGHSLDYWGYYGYQSRCYDYEVDDLIDEEVAAYNLVSPSGKGNILGSVSLDKEVVVPDGVYDAKPDEEECKESTGNAGATIDKLYRHAALLLWPRDHRVTVLGLDRMMIKLDESLSKYATSDLPTQKEEKYLKLAVQLVIKIKLSDRKPSTKAAVAMLCSLRILGVPQLACEFLSAISALSSSYLQDKHFTETLIAMSTTLSWDKVQPGLLQLVEKCTSDDVEVCCKFLNSFASCVSALPPQQLEVGQQFASIVCNFLVAEQDTMNRTQPAPYVNSIRSHNSCRTKEFVCHLFEAFSALSCGDKLEAVLSSIACQPNRYPLTTVLVPAIEQLQQWVQGENAQFLSLVTHCVTSLERSTQDAVPKPQSWSQQVNVGCSCSDCIQLQAFLNDPVKTQARFKVAKARRFHLHRQLDNHCCDATHVTERTGSPQTLVVTKTRRSYKAELAEHQNKLRLLDQLRPLYSQLTCESQSPSKRPRVGHLEVDTFEPSVTCIDLTAD